MSFYLINKQRLLDAKQSLRDIDTLLNSIEVTEALTCANIRLQLMVLANDLNVAQRQPAGGAQCSCKQRLARAAVTMSG